MQNDVKNRPLGQFFTSSPRYEGDVKTSLPAHDVLTSPALIDFFLKSALRFLEKTWQSGGSLSKIGESYA
jgi:hypothetical protein